MKAPVKPLPEVVATMLVGSALAAGVAGLACFILGAAGPGIVLVVLAAILLGDGLYLSIQAEQR